MSNYRKHSWVIFPLLSVLSMSPAELTTRHQASRQMASVVTEIESKHPRFDKLINKVDKANPAQETSIDKFLEKTGAINSQLKKEREDFKKNIDKKEEVAKQRKGLEGFVSDVVVLEEELKILKDKKLLLEEDEKFVTKSIEDFKTLSEDLLTDLEANETLVAKTEGPEKAAETKKEEVLPELSKIEEPAVPAVAEIPKEEQKVEGPKEEAVLPAEVTPVAPVAKEEPKEVEAPAKVVAAAKGKEEAKEKEEKKVSKKKEKDDCDKEGKEKVLSPQANELAAQQSLIMQQMMTMNQMIMMTLQQQQMQIFQMQQSQQLQGPVNQQAYQYIAPTNGGQWVFQPSGGNRPGLFPDQLRQQQAPQGYNGWGLSPNNYFQNQQQWMPMQIQPGQFGGAPAIGFNMQQPMLNTPGLMGQMIQPQIFPPGPQPFQI